MDKSRILIINDNKSDNEKDSIVELLGDSYDITEKNIADRNFEDSLEEMASMSVIIVSIPPDVNKAFIVLEALKKCGLYKRIPIVIYCGVSNVEVARWCYEYGAYDYIYPPLDEVIVKARIRNAIDRNTMTKLMENKIKSQNDTLNKQFKLLKMQAEELKSSNNSIIEILGTVVECRNLENGDHVRRVREYSRILATHMMEMYPGTGLTKDRIDMIASASALHDIGKIAIPDNILLKPGKLTKEEFDFMKSHTIRGAEIIEQIKDIWDEAYAKECAEICRFHHERYDGKGYPDGLTGDDIPIGAQCVSIADVYDVLVNERVYKSAYTPDQAFQMIISGECGIFAPKLLECFRKAKAEFEALSQKKDK